MSYPLKNKTKINEIKMIMKRIFKINPKINWDNMILLQDYTIFFSDKLNRISIRTLPSTERFRIVQFTNEELIPIKKQLLRLYNSILVNS